MKNDNIKKEIKSCYARFFKKFDVNSKSGVYKKDNKLKFATYPYIGSQYGTKTKILFIGLDIGEDTQKSIISFQKRQKDIGNDENYNNCNKNQKTYNPHIAGTSVTAAHFSNKEIFEKIENTKNYKEAICIFKKMGMENPLAYVTLTNFYKFVTKGKKLRGDSSDRKYVSRESREFECERV